MVFTDVHIFLVVFVAFTNVQAQIDCGCCSHCPDGWVYFENSCYLFGDDDVKFTWSEAALTQDRSYIYLFKVDNRDDDAFWVGATDEIIEGIWKWYTDDSNLSYTNWARGQPDSHDGHEEDCLYLYGDNYGWHDGPCEAHKHALCEHSGPLQCPEL